MADIFLEFGADLVLTADGDIQIAKGWDEVRQRIERFILTNPATTQTDGTVIPADYIQHQDYGLGARAMVGNLFTQETVDAISQIIYEATLQDPGINPAVPPVITSKLITPFHVEFTIAVTLLNGQQQTIIMSLP